MVGPGRRTQVILLLVMALARVAAGQGNPAGGPPGGEGTTRTGDQEELEEVLRTLDEAGVPPTREEIAGFLRDNAADANRDAGGGPSSWFTGAVSYRMGSYTGEGLDHYGKMSLETNWLRLRGRIREYRTGERERSGAVELAWGPGELRAGNLGLAQGFGLLSGAPGRGASLGADGRFGPAPGRLVTWLGAEEARAVAAVGGSFRLRGWDLRFLREVPAGAADPRAGPRAILQLGFRGRDWNLAAAGQSSGNAAGASVAAGWVRGPVSGSLEVMGWGPDRGLPPAGAGVLQIRWSPERGAGVEGMCGFANLQEKPPMSSRPAVLPGWTGRGAALRGFTRLGTGMVLKALVHAGRHLDRGAARSRNDKMLIDIQCSRKLHPAVEASLRVRRDTRRRWQWSTRYPWQVPELADTGHRTVVSAVFSYEAGPDRVKVLVRTYALESGTGGGRRSLLGLSGRRRLGRGWQVRSAWGSAWGDPVDLVSAVSPVSGYVLPRHWGKWRSETLLGLEKTARGVRAQAAMSVRRPEPDPAAEPAVTIWVRAEFYW